MKHTYIIIIISLLFFSCESKKPIEIKQTTSKEMVTFEDNFMDRKQIKDSVRISFPIEFKIEINSSIEYIAWIYRVNNKTLDKDYFDYEVYNKHNKTKSIRQLDFDKTVKSASIDIIVKERNHLISRKDAQQVLKKYHINKSLDNLKPTETIKLVAYDKFRKENKLIIQELNKISDSIHFRAMKKDGSFFYVEKKINW
ncbi:hypothetical protein [Flavobacterium quisquiliarum]|uniref:Lipoprotein n=1 Tax=Flavobacterium quisquiliarum TaxID=1834436 RepID=A0ABV8WAK5_9FLAO|nr:hypothetical protein [Flavobacterium quisquiliarum]MBW1655220.1 hypothetical protein [Flavobacterium quisquiliarum]NWL00605.1 hypothetical protein [Flavobacterium collinsii]